MAAAGFGWITRDLERKMQRCLLQYSRRVTRNQRPEQPRNGQKFEYHVSRSPIHTAGSAATLPDYRAGFFDRNDTIFTGKKPVDRGQPVVLRTRIAHGTTRQSPSRNSRRHTLPYRSSIQSMRCLVAAFLQNVNRPKRTT